MIKPILKSEPKLFCEQYWTRVLKETPKPKTRPVAVNDYFDITDINEMLVGTPISYYYWLKESMRNPINKMIAQFDKEFKLLQPTKENKVMWRGIAEPPKDMYKERLSRFEARFNSKKGDIIYMPEYALASDTKGYSEFFMKNPHRNRGLIYEIFVPKGSKISRGSHNVFPRGSRFECTDVKSFSENGKDYKVVYVNYINPCETKNKNTNFLQKLFSKVNIF